MTRPRLGRVPPEEVTLLQRVEGPPGELGESTVTYVAGPAHEALVTPLTAEQAVKAGLTTHVARWRVRLPGGLVLTPGDRLRFRGRDWVAVTVALYRSYTRVIAEGVGG